MVQHPEGGGHTHPLLFVSSPGCSVDKMTYTVEQHFIIRRVTDRGRRGPQSVYTDNTKFKIMLDVTSDVD